MAITFQKRQKEMKRLEKQREKAERRAQKKLAKRTDKENGVEPETGIEQLEVLDGPVNPELSEHQG
ncbi:MAG TPA: hypothetical protein VJX70_03485 [Candidatus Acidoferrum sp.]|nr:hypothetical protein [Candidatus Acidoferrum sp.]